MNNQYRAKLARVAHLSPWFWIMSIFGAQAAGSLAVTVLFKLSLRETLLPILILLLGMAASGLLARRNSPAALSAWARCIPFLLYGLFIYSLSSRDYPDAQVSMNTDLFHLVEFSTLGFFLSCFWYPLLKRVGVSFFFAVVLGCGLLFALTDELHQHYVPGRMASAGDLLYDGTALALACLVFLAGVNLRLSLQRATMESGE
ncbi:MAG: VanZ family protein [Syntrophobacteraceae bacterium]